MLYVFEVVRVNSEIDALDPSYVIPVTVWPFSLVHSRVEKTPVTTHKPQILVVFNE